MYGSSSSFLNPTLGFASNLSHTIIREAHEDDDRSIKSDISTSTTISISDEELALLGAPWAKEGMLCRKQYWESTGKRAKDKAWLDVFVVIQKGDLSMFIFGEHSAGGSGTFGGGNWLANAHSVGTVNLAHSLAHPLPPPGYNRQRPYCMVLTLSNGGVYFFQAGTEELVNEWVSTCNYWAARTSKEPLAGGVSNMEYGWSRIVDLNGQRASVSQTESLRERDYDSNDTVSMKSGKSGHSKFKWRGDGTVRGPPSPWAGEKLFINDWKPPMPPSVASTHDEETQLDALRKHVSSLKKDLETHNELRDPLMQLVGPLQPPYLATIADDYPVPTTQRECNEGSQQLGEEIAVAFDRDRQVRLLYRFSSGCDGLTLEKTRRKRSVHAGSERLDHNFSRFPSDK